MFQDVIKNTMEVYIDNMLIIGKGDHLKDF